MNKFISCLIMSVLSTGMALADASPTHYQFSVRVPASKGGCAVEASNLVMAFSATHANLQNLIGQCADQSSFQENGVTYTLDTLVVEYDALKALVPFKVILDVDGMSAAGDITSVYPAYANCLADLSAQQSAFNQATGLNAFAATCEASSNMPDSGYKLNLQALGSSNVRLYQIHNSSYESLTKDAAWLNQIAAALKASGATITKQLGETFFYYSPVYVSLKSETLIRTYSAQECTDQVAQAHAMFTKAGAQVLTLVCHANDMGETLDVITDVGQSYFSDYGVGSQVYYSYASCTKDLVRLQAQAIAAGDTSTFMFCSQNDGGNSRYQIENYRNW